MPSVRYPTREARRYDVVAFGEAMVRLTPPNHERLEVARSLDMAVGGAELNAAVALSRLRRPAAWVSALPDDALGRFIANQARLHGVSRSEHYQTIIQETTDNPFVEVLYESRVQTLGLVHLSVIQRVIQPDTRTLLAPGQRVQYQDN